MHKRFKILIFAAALLILFGGAGSLLTVQSGIGNESGMETKRVDADSVHSINIQAVNGKINTVRSEDAKQATVEWSGPVKGDGDRLSVGKNNGELSVRLESNPFKLFSFGFDFFNKNELTVSLPEKSYDSLHVKSNNGKIVANQLEARDVTIQTDNGQVDLNHLTTDQINVGMDNGQLLMKDISGNVTGRTDNGEIRLTTSDLDRDIDLTTNNGRIIVQTDKRPSNALLDAHTDNGIVSLFGRENRKTVYGDADHHVKLTTNNGMITVKE
ncbi:hypothetical protein GCM10028778_19530 [Barrientosiimonas marina]|uniref:DUF4097 family beta strand repeat-containing protein n=1 Tax=Lentibacillus kimchii TaxID=1542911 RepID=A0ABW2UUJ1_9BACI